MLLAWLAHLYTASGAVFAFLAARAVIDFDYRTAFFWLGRLVEYDRTDKIFTAPAETLTEDYVTGRFG